MDKDRDLLPWILGGLSMATVALAITVASTNRTAPGLLAATQPTALLKPQAIADNSPAPTAPPVPMTRPAMAAAPVPAQAPSQPPAANQIWECTINGQKTFASKPCGSKSTLLEVGPINTMEAAPLLPPSRSYEPQASYPPDFYYPDVQDSVDNAYPVAVVRPFIERRRPEHAHRPRGQDRGTPARKN